MDQFIPIDTFVLSDELITYYTDINNLLVSINDTLILMIIIFGFCFGVWFIYVVLKSIMR